MRLTRAAGEAHAVEQRAARRGLHGMPGIHGSHRSPRAGTHHLRLPGSRGERNGRRGHAAGSTAGRARGGPAPHRRVAPAQPAPIEPAGPDLRTLLARSERHVDELRRSASELAAILPTRVEAAVARALGEDEGGLGRRIDHVVDQDGRLAAALERVESDLLAERMARVEDLEVLVELVSGGLTSLRADLRAVRGSSRSCRPSSAGRSRSRSPASRPSRRSDGRRRQRAARCACGQASKTRTRARTRSHPDAS